MKYPIDKELKSISIYSGSVVGWMYPMINIGYRLQKVLERSGKSSIRQRAYQTEKIPDDFLEKILERARMHIAGLK